VMDTIFAIDLQKVAENENSIDVENSFERKKMCSSQKIRSFTRIQLFAKNLVCRKKSSFAGKLSGAVFLT